MNLSDKYLFSRKAGFYIILIVYIVATVVGVFLFQYYKQLDDIWRLLIADVGATIIVWLFGVLFKNSSIYDPYWSVAPPILLTVYAYYLGHMNTAVILLLIGVWVWAIRLTINWAYTFKNLSIQDWRYDKYKNDFPRLWHFLNFTGINMMPTLIVFGAMLPGIYLIQGLYTANIYTAIGLLICLLAAGLQYFSDTQIHRFKKENQGKVCQVGLWKYSRHPNYLGEILMWWGVFVMLYSVNTELWWTSFGAFANTLLFVVVSIPLMEKRQLKNKPEFAIYKKTTGMLFPKFW